MKVALFGCVALLAVLLQAEDGMAPPSLPADTRLANGRPAVPRQFPHLAYIEPFLPDGTRWNLCVGSLITRSAVLTTVAWCVSNHTATKWTVRLGSIYRQGEDPNAWTVESVMAIKHPKYNSENLDNNIAIIQLPRLAPVNEFIQPVSLPSSPVASSYLGCQGIVGGWGQTGSGISDVLRWAEVLVVHNDICKQFSGSYAVTDRQLCAGSSNATVHHADHGAPLVLYTRGRYTQIAVFSYPTSWEFNTSHPAIYTRVTPYLDWIKLYTESD